jgi:hypothetical protein
LSKYNAFFQRFVNELLSATIIQRKGDLLVRNSVFTKQKFTYKRGVYMGLINTYSSDNATTFTYDNQLEYFGNDGSTFLKRQLLQDTNWSDDVVCVNDLCLTLKVANVEVLYSTTTTTTTQYPYSSVMMINETLTDQGLSDDGYNESIYRITSYNIQLSPTIMPGYIVLTKFDFVSELNINTSGNLSASNITIKKNNVVVFTINNNNISQATMTVNDSSNVSIENGDVIDVTLENYLTRPTGTINTPESTTTMTPSVLSVVPNGTVSSIMPINVTNNISF